MIFQTECIIIRALCISILLNFKISHALPDVRGSEKDDQQINQDDKNEEFEMMETIRQLGEDLGNVSQVLNAINQKLNGLEAERIRQTSEISKKVDQKVNSLNDRLQHLETEMINRFDAYSKNMTQLAQQDEKYSRNITESTNNLNRRLDDLEMKTNRIDEYNMNNVTELVNALNRKLNDLEATKIHDLLEKVEKNEKSLEKVTQSENSLVHRFDYLEDKISKEAVEKNFTRLVNSLNHKQEDLGIKITEESRRRLSGEIVQEIKSNRFSDAAQKLKQADYDSYCYTVREIYDHKIDKVALLRRFWDSISDTEIKINIYRALHDEIKVRSLTDGQSHYNALWSIFEDGVSNLIAESIRKDGPVIHLAHLKCFQCIVDIGKKVIRKLWGNLTLENVMQKARNKLKNAEEQIAFQTALFHELESRKEVYTKNSVILARNMKLTTEDADYNSVSSELKSQHEAIKNKLPASVKNLVFSSTVCMKNATSKQYTYASTNSKGIYLNTTVFSAYVGLPKDKNNSPEFKWHISFETPDVIYIRNERFNTYLTEAQDVADKKFYAAVVGRGPPESSTRWNLNVLEDNIRITPSGTLFLDENIRKGEVVRFVYKDVPNNGYYEKQIEDCS